MKIEMRTHCKECGDKITKKRFRTFCSKKCRDRHTNLKYREYHDEWMRKKRAKYSEGKIQCLICGGWFHQVCSHVVQIHEISKRDYKKLIGKDVKKGIITKELYDLRREQNLENKKKVWKNLKEGEAHWFQKGEANTYKRSKETMARLRRKQFAPHITNNIYNHEGN